MPLTTAKMITITPGQPAQIPPELTQQLQQTSAIAIATTGEIRIIPTQSPQTIKITITIDKLTQKFLKELGAIILKNNLTFLYTTGLCKKGKQCYYEAYIDKAQLKTDPQQLQQQIQQIQGVSTVEITTIT